MDDREKFIEQTVKFLKSIKTLDDVKEHKKEIFDAVLGIFKSALEIVKSFFVTSKSLSTEEKAKEFSKFQDDSFILPPEVDQEMERIYNLSGADKILNEFQQELEEQMEPIVEEISEHMSKLAEEFFGPILSDMAEGLEQGFEETFGAEEGDQNLSSEPGEREKLDVGQDLYKIQSLEDLKNHETKIVEQIEEQLNYDLEAIKTNQNMGMINDSTVREALIRIEKRQKLLERELDREFIRIEALPDAKEYASEAKEKIKNCLEPTVTQINGLLKELKNQE